MKTKKNFCNKRLAFNTVQKIMAAVLFILVLASCSKDDEGPSDSITAKAATSSFEAVNTCPMASGSNGTNFHFTIPYSKSSKSEISFITVKLEWPTAPTSSSVASNFTDNSTSLTYSRCYRFADQDWVEITQYVVLEGGIGSNPSKVRVNRPEGAN